TSPIRPAKVTIVLGFTERMVAHPGPWVKFTTAKAFRTNSTSTFPQNVVDIAAPASDRGGMKVTVVREETLPIPFANVLSCTALTNQLTMRLPVLVCDVGDKWEILPHPSSP